MNNACGQDLQPPFFSAMAKNLDGIVCPSSYHASVLEPEIMRSLARVVSLNHGLVSWYHVWP